MTRLVRVVVEGVPHHVTQRGNRRQPTFFRPEDYPTYLDLMAAACIEHGLEVWAWCLMPNHVHLVAVPGAPESLALGCNVSGLRPERRKPAAAWLHAGALRADGNTATAKARPTPSLWRRGRPAGGPYKGTAFA